MSDSCDFRQYLAAQGLKLTPVRLAVLEVLGDASRALRAQEILAAIRARRRVNKVTIYRILEDFSRRGIVRRLSLQGRVNHYELACEHRPPHPAFPVPHLPGNRVPGPGADDPRLDRAARAAGKPRRSPGNSAGRGLP